MSKKRKRTILPSCLAAGLSLSLFALSAQAAESTQAPQLTQEHVRYMEGFPDGTFRPDLQLTRAQAAQMVSSLLINLDSGTGSCHYQDVPAEQWYAPAVTALCKLGLFNDGLYFHPDDIITRAEFIDLLVRLHSKISVQTDGITFSDVSEEHWAASQIDAAVSMGWISGYPDGTFRPEQGLTRAEACMVITQMTQRFGNNAQTDKLLRLGLYQDVEPSYWAALAIVEATVPHTASSISEFPEETPEISEELPEQESSDLPENTLQETPEPQSSDKPFGLEDWATVDLSALNFQTIGFQTLEDRLFYVDRYGKLAVNTTLGAYTADIDGALTQTSPSYFMPDVPYFSQIDQLNAWVGCESVAAFTGLRAKGYVGEVDLKTFVTDQPRSDSDPEKGFVGDPFVPDTSKRTRTTIYPAKLAEYSNSYCGGDTPCADFRGADLTQLQQELLAGNCVVAYVTLWWEPLYYRTYLIEGETQRLVSNNHAVLVYGYDPEQGYLISDPYNDHKRGQVYQYWKSADIFESLWLKRQVGMVIR